MKVVVRSAASLLSALLGLASALVHLATVLVLRAASAVERRKGEARASGSGAVKRAPLRAVESTPEAERLTAALVRLGFRAPAVRAFVNGLGARVEQEPTEKLIREGLAKLAA